MIEPDLFEYQRTGAEFLKNRKYAALFDGMRLGKTRQFLKAAKDLGSHTTAVVAKASGVFVWEKEAAEWGFDPVILKNQDEPQPGKFNILSYNGLIGSTLHPKLMKMDIDVLGGDESDAFKNMKAKRTKAFYGPKMDKRGGIVDRAGRVYIMTGTPILNHPAELYPALRALFPDTILKSDDTPMSYWQFVNAYCTTMDNGFGIQITGGKNLKHLREQMRGRVLRRVKEEVWQDWEKPRFDLLPVQGKIDGIPGEEIAAVERVLASSDQDIVKALQKAADQAPTLRRLTGLAKVKGVVEWCRDNIDQAGKIIIFAHHKEVIERIKAELNAPFAQIIGGMCSEAKANSYNRFQTDPSCKYFIGQNQAARDSIPLWAASTTISVEPDWVPGNNDQMMDRMVHFSKKEPCVGYYATLKGSIDERIQAANIRKKGVSEELGFN
jgi:SNF2 family DNA or RNA helicase